MAHNHGQLDHTQSYHLIREALLVETDKYKYPYANVVVVDIHVPEWSSGLDEHKQDYFTIVLVGMANPLYQYPTLSYGQLNVDDKKNFKKTSLSMLILKTHTRLLSVVDVYHIKFLVLFQSHLSFFQRKFDYEKYNDLGFGIDYVPALPTPMPGEHF